MENPNNLISALTSAWVTKAACRLEAVTAPELAAKDPPQFENLSFETERNPYNLVTGEILSSLFLVEIAEITHRRDWLFCLLDVVGIESPNCFETAFGGHHIYLLILLQGYIEGASLASQPVLQGEP